MTEVGSLGLPARVADGLAQFTGRTWLLVPLLDWLERSGERVFLLTGEPGTGKSMVAAWLAGAGQVPSHVADRERLERFRARVGAAHFCLADGGVNAPRAFAQHAAEQLTDHVDGFGAALAATLGDRVRVTGSVSVGSAAAGARVAGVYVGRLDLGDLGDEPSFDRVVREPLKRLYQDGYQQPLVIVIDALDEALTYTGVTLVRLLTRLADLPPQVRVLATTRPDPRVLDPLRRARRIDLIQDAPAGSNDVHDYALERLTGVAAARRARLAARIAEAADGIFLYARLLLDDLTPRLTAEPDLDLAALPLPDGLSGLYQDFLDRELGADRSRWYNSVRPVLGLLTVAQGDGLDRPQLERLTGREADEVLELCRQYLDGAWPDGPFRPFHRSFAEFLLGGGPYHIDAPRMHAEIADHYWPPTGGTPRWRSWDAYGLRFATLHMIQALSASAGASGGQEQRLQRLVAMVADPDFQAAYQKALDDPVGLQQDLEQALAAASAADDPALVVHAALGLAAFGGRYLRPEVMFRLARNGRVQAAERRLRLFKVEADWQRVALLAIAWLAAGQDTDAARRLRDHVLKDTPPTGPLAVLAARVDADLQGIPPPLPPLPVAPAPEVAQGIIDRIGGRDTADAELLAMYYNRFLGEPAAASTGTTGYLAEQDGPRLVAYAIVDPTRGRELLRQYLAVHTSNNYVTYRNRSLWWVLDAVLRHPDQAWVREMVTELATAATAGRVEESREATSLTLLALQAKVGKPAAEETLRKRLDRLRREIAKLASSRGRGDTWGWRQRALAALAEASSRILGRDGHARTILDQATSTPPGFAGFQAPTSLLLAESFQVCAPERVGERDRCLDDAEATAHHIQDATFCARTTARVNAMRQRWWPSPRSGPDLTATIERLCREPDAPEFAAVHMVGEQYRYRRGPGLLPLPESLRQARTLRALAAAYHRPLAEFQRLNEAHGWTEDEPLPADALVNVPDPRFAPRLAARLAAEVLAEASLPDAQGVRLLQALVPVAASAPTALDTVLSRLLLAARPSDLGELDSMLQASMPQAAAPQHGVGSVAPVP